MADDWVVGTPAAAVPNAADDWVVGTGLNSPEHVAPYKSALRGAGQGVSFGLSDEGIGGAQAIIDWLKGKPFVESYQKARDAERAANTAAEKANPGTYLAGELAGGLVTPGGLTRIGAVKSAEEVAKLGLKARALQAAKEGAAYGAAYGFGKGEGAEDSLINAAKGSAIGAPLGASLPAAVDIGSGIVRGVTTPIRAVLRPTAVGNEKFAEALMRDMAPATGDLNPKALVDRAAQRAKTAQSIAPDAVMADVGGENTRNLLRSAANMPSTEAERLRKTLDRRQSFQPLRIERDLADTLGNPSEYASSIDSIVAKRDAAAKPLFDAAMKVPIKPDDQLIGVLQRPGMKSILERVVAKMENEGVPVEGSPPMVVLHRAKMEIDKAIGEVKRGQSNTANWDVRTLTKMKHDLLDAVPNPVYREALKVSAGENALKNAAEDGLENALKLPTEEISKTLAKLTPSEQDMWRMGAARAIAGRYLRSGNVMRDKTEAFGSRDMQLRLAELFPDNASRREFQRQLVMEAKMADTRKAVQGNSTTAKQLAQADEAAQPMRAAVALGQAGMGRMEPVVAWLSRQAQRFSGLTPSTATAIIQAAMQKSGVKSQKAWEDAIAKAEKEPAFRAQLVRRLLASGSSAQGESTPAPQP